MQWDTGPEKRPVRAHATHEPPRSCEILRPTDGEPAGFDIPLQWTSDPGSTSARWLLDGVLVADGRTPRLETTTRGRVDLRLEVDLPRSTCVDEIDLWTGCTPWATWPDDFRTEVSESDLLEVVVGSNCPQAHGPLWVEWRTERGAIATGDRPQGLDSIGADALDPGLNRLTVTVENSAGDTASTPIVEVYLR